MSSYILQANRFKLLKNYNTLISTLVLTICAFCLFGCKASNAPNNEVKIETTNTTEFLQEAIEIEDTLIDDDEVAYEPKEEKIVRKPKPSKKTEKKLSADLVKNYKTAVPKKKVKDPNRPILKFDYLTYDFGDIDEGDIVEHEYYFTNTGRTPAIISDASSSCGCTTPNYPKYPIRPGERGSIKVVFDSKGRLLSQRKSITITANTDPNYTTMYLTGEVWRTARKNDVIPTTVPSIKDQLNRKTETNNQKITNSANLPNAAITPSIIERKKVAEPSKIQAKVKPIVQRIPKKENTSKPK